MKVSVNDLVAGGIFTGFGLYFSITAYTSLSIGTATMMGPGYFPIVIGLFLLLLGFAIMARALGGMTEAIRFPPLQSVVMVAATPIAFGLTVRGLGFGPATLLAAFIASMASPEANWRFRLALAVALTVFCLMVFRFALNLPLPIIGYWLR